jgi:hypothetical protein
MHPPIHPVHPTLTPDDVLASGGWHPRYVRVLAVASEGDYGIAVVDGNGDGAELEQETWFWDDGRWTPGASSGTGPLDTLGAIQTGGEVGDACFAFGRAPSRPSVTVSFGGQTFEVPVGPHGVWAFIKAGPGPAPALTA